MTFFKVDIWGRRECYLVLTYQSAVFMDLHSWLRLDVLSLVLRRPSQVHKSMLPDVNTAVDAPATLGDELSSM